MPELGAWHKDASTKTALKWIFSHINVRTGTLDKSERRYRLWKNDKVIAEYTKTIPKEVEA